MTKRASFLLWASWICFWLVATALTHPVVQETTNERFVSQRMALGSEPPASEVSVCYWVDLAQANGYVQSLGGQPIGPGTIRFTAEQPSWYWRLFEVEALTEPDGITMYGCQGNVTEWGQVMLYHELSHWALMTQPWPANLTSLVWRWPMTLFVVPWLLFFVVLPAVYRAALGRPRSRALAHGCATLIAAILLGVTPLVADVEELYVGYRAWQAWNAGAAPIAQCSHSDRSPNLNRAEDLSWEALPTDRRTSYQQALLVEPWLGGIARMVLGVLSWAVVALEGWLLYRWLLATPPERRQWRAVLSLVLVSLFGLLLPYGIDSWATQVVRSSEEGVIRPTSNHDGTTLSFHTPALSPSVAPTGTTTWADPSASPTAPVSPSGPSGSSTTPWVDPSRVSSASPGRPWPSQSATGDWRSPTPGPLLAAPTTTPPAWPVYLTSTSAPIDGDPNRYVWFITVMNAGSARRLELIVRTQRTSAPALTFQAPRGSSFKRADGTWVDWTARFTLDRAAVWTCSGQINRRRLGTGDVTVWVRDPKTNQSQRVTL